MKANLLWMLFGRIGFALSQWLIVIVIGQLQGPELLGQYSYAVAVCTPVIVFSQLNMANYLATDSATEYRFSTYFQARFIGSCIALLLIIAFAMFATQDVGRYVLLLLAINKSIESLSDIFYGKFLQAEKMRFVAVSLAMRGGFAVLLITLTIWFMESLNLGLVLVAAAWLLVLFAHDYRIYSATCGSDGGIDFRFNWRHIRRLSASCLPLGFVMMLGSFNVNAPVYIIEATWGVEEVGLYAAVAYFYFVGRLVSTPVIQSLAPRLASLKAKSNYTELRNLTHRVFGLMAILSSLMLFVVYVFGEVFLSFVYGPHFGNGSDLLVWMIVASVIGFYSQYLSACLTVSRSLVEQLYLNILVFGAICLIGIFAIEKFGVVGGGVALTAAEIIMLMGNLWYVDKRFIIHWSEPSPQP